MSRLAGKRAFVTGAGQWIGQAVARDFIRTGVPRATVLQWSLGKARCIEHIRATSDLEATHRVFAERQPIGRLDKVEEIATAALYLAYDASSFTAGTVTVVHGGQTL